MKRITRSFVEKFYRDADVCERVVEEVEERNPMKIKNEKALERFRFYDRNFVIDGEKICDGGISNYSNWILMGKRLSLEEFKTQYVNNPNQEFMVEFKHLLKYLEIKNYQYVCYIKRSSFSRMGGFIPMEEGEMTFDEIIDTKEVKKEKLDKQKEKIKKYY